MAMQFGIIEYTEKEGFREKNGISSYHHGLSALPDGFTVQNNLSAFDVIYFTALVPGTVVFDLKFPAPLTGRNLKSALLFELEQRIPVALDQVTYGYVRTSRSNRKYRVYATRLDAVAKVLEKLQEEKLCCDCFLPAQLLAGEESDVLLPPADLLWSHLKNDPGGRNLHLSVDPIPRELRPVRHRKWRTVFNVTFTIAVILAVALLGLRLQQAVKGYRTLKEEQERLSAKLQVVKATERRLLRAEALNAKLREAQLGSSSALNILNDLNARLPVSMYITGYTQTGDQVDVVIKAAEINANLPRILLASPLYEAEIKKTVQTPDNGAVYNVHLKERQP